MGRLTSVQFIYVDKNGLRDRIAFVESACLPGHFTCYLCFLECARRFQLCLFESAMREIKN